MIPNVKNLISKSGDFMEQKTKKIFLETSKDRKPYHMEHLKMRYKNQIYFTENIRKKSGSIFSLHQTFIIIAQEMCL